ncbi:MAG: sigma-54-dependent Fis family transcriptional regulator [Gemmatimonadetes bacterium]|jgi:two-component system, NtrC family, response regulator HydG|nr:sigma-54-dependent Fis family transcriptional regulator [Gemmatimonadota bacterium]
MPDTARILIVDDTPSAIKALGLRLTAAGHQVIEATGGLEALQKIKAEDPDLVLLDVVMPGMDGYEVCRRIKERQKADFVPVIMVTARTETESIVRALEGGADEYIAKPFDPLELTARVNSMLRIRRMYQENTHLRREIAGQQSPDLIGQSPAMDRILQLLPKVIDSEVTILLTGESGTGKDAVARCIHSRGPRQSKPFVAVNCGALAESLLESELFGHKKGAYTGAGEDRAGLFETADGGTLLLDEICETSPGMQVKLLRALQEREIIRVGETQARKIDVRIIAAANHDLEGEVAADRFREDLYYRLSVFPIHLPPLRQRRDDIPLLARRFLEKRSPTDNRSAGEFTPETLDALTAYDWPGNVRELENEIERALVLLPPGEPIGLEHLSEKLRGNGRAKCSWRRDGKLKDIIAEVEDDLIQKAFATFDGNRTRMAENLGISRYTLLQKIKEYGIGDS